MQLLELRNQLDDYDDDAEIIIAVITSNGAYCYMGDEICKSLYANGNKVQITIILEPDNANK